MNESKDLINDVLNPFEYLNLTFIFGIFILNLYFFIVLSLFTIQSYLNEGI